MSTNSHLKRAMLLTGLVAGFGVAKPASAMLVFDPITEGATITTAALTGAILVKIKRIDSNINHMTGTLDAIKGDTGVIVGHQARIDGFTGTTADMTTNISYKTDYNTTNENYTWINNYYGDDNGTIPILRPASDGKFLSGVDSDSYQNGYQAADYYKDKMGSNNDLADTALKSSQNQKNANDLLVDSLNEQRKSLSGQVDSIKNLANRAIGAQGTNSLMQGSNALAGAQVAQMVEMRSLMMAQANAQAAAQQAALDKDARHIASAQSLRTGLKVINTSATVASDAQ
jgi:hypothetical protein